MSQRMTVVALVVLAIIAALILFVWATPLAQGATCASRPGISHGSVWWRWRYAESGARCWYPGQRYRVARHHRVVALRFRPKNKPPQIKREKGTTVPEPAPVVRAVRVVPIYGGLSANERIERAFDKLTIMPVEDEP